MATPTQRLIGGATLLVVVACRPAPDPRAGDSAFADVQRRGATVMGVDQYTSRHVFETLPDGGRIVLDRDDASDRNDIDVIRTHMRDVERAFRAGDFRMPGMVHGREVPGTRVMAAKRDVIAYRAIERPRGAEVRITTADSSALAAVHEFLTFQRSDHRAPGHDSH